MTSADIGRVIARAWSEDSFRSRLQVDPSEALRECGLAQPEGVTIHFHMNTSSDLHIVIPEAPKVSVIPSGTAEEGGGCRLFCRGDNSW